MEPNEECEGVVWDLCGGRESRNAKAAHHNVITVVNRCFFSYLGKNCKKLQVFGFLGSWFLVMW